MTIFSCFAKCIIYAHEYHWKVLYNAIATSICIPNAQCLAYFLHVAPCIHTDHGQPM